ncbi:MAG: aspartyl-phosphate phosphatase Spo0E family protein [Firmicutes bacterium]|nr:aspartyl-phosphate phosphatase Spo0E family protein [Bacillota bacterium]
MSVEHSGSQIRQLDQEIEIMREKLHRLVSADPAQLRSTEVYRLSRELDRLIDRLHQIKQFPLK